MSLQRNTLPIFEDSQKDRGFFVVIDGIDGSGKTSVVGCLPTLAEELGRKARCVRAPGGTKLGEKIRDIFIEQHNTGKSDPGTDLLLLLAAKRALYHQVIEPALNRGECVIADRWVESMYAYQGAAFGVASSTIGPLIDTADIGKPPDLTIILDLPVEVARARLEERNDGKNALDRLPLHVCKRMRACYKRRARFSRNGGDFYAGVHNSRYDAQQNPIVTVDASKPFDRVLNAVVKAFEMRYREHFGS